MLVLQIDLLLLLLVAFQSIATASISSFSVEDNFIINTIQHDSDREMHINNILKDPLKYKDYPPIISFPQLKQRTLKDGEIPQYVLDYCPVVYLYSEERYLPYDIQQYVTNFNATYGNGTIIADNLTLKKLGKLPKSQDIYLSSLQDFTKNPEWITGLKNKPNLVNGEIKDAPATLIVVDKGNGWIDAYWFYFYSFNLGPFVMGQGPYGNHVGDWEHSLVRFYKGEPIIVWMSAHGGGGAFYYHNLEKYDDSNHPVIFSARGTHANYPSVGQHPHDLPYGILSDFTDRGPLWNPLKNYLGYTFDGKRIYPTTKNANLKHSSRELEYGNWLSYSGHWGDMKLDDNDPRQSYSFIGGTKYIDGPLGPLMKNLMRLKPCERHKWWNFWDGCNVRENIKWGIGVESEGYNCGNMFINVKPKWIRNGLQRVTWGGGLCFIVDLIYG